MTGLTWKTAADGGNLHHRPGDSRHSRSAPPRRHSPLPLQRAALVWRSRSSAGLLPVSIRLFAGGVYGVHMDTSTRAHAEAMRKGLHELVAELVDQLGPTVVQAMTGSRDRSMPAAWAKEDGPTPRQMTQNQLRLGYRVWSMMRDAEGPNVAAAWMTGANPRLGESPPLTAIREMRPADVVGAAEAFIDGTYVA